MLRVFEGRKTMLKALSGEIRPHRNCDHGEIIYKTALTIIKSEGRKTMLKSEFTI